MPANTEATFAAYSITAGPTGKPDEPLGSVLGKDVLALFEAFVNERTDKLEDIAGEQELRQFSDINVAGRRVFGYVLSGSYGRRGAIMRRNQGKVFDKTRDDADMLRFFFSAYIPSDSTNGILIVQSQGTSGVVNLFQGDFINYVRQKNLGVAIRIDRIAPANYVSAILGNGQVKSIRFLKYKAPDDLAARLESQGLAEQYGSVELQIKPKRNATFALFDQLKKRIGGNPGDDGLVKLAGPGWENPDKTLVTVDVNGRSRTLQVDSLDVGRPDIIQQFELSQDDGMPKWDDLVKYTQELTNDLLTALQVGP